MLCVDTPRRAATSATGRPCSATCLTAATLNSSVNRALLINVSLRRYYEAKMCLVNLGRFKLFITKAIKCRDLATLLSRHGVTTSLIRIIIAFSLLFGEFLPVVLVSDALANFMISADICLEGNMLTFMVLLIIFGCFIETIAPIIILMPLLLPIAGALDIDMVHLGVFVVCTLTIGYITPPVGINLFAASAVSEVPYLSIAARVWPLFLALIVAVFVIAFVPSLSLWFM